MLPKCIIILLLFNFGARKKGRREAEYEDGTKGFI